MKRLFYGGLVLYAIIFIMLLFYVFMASAYCHDTHRNQTYLSITQQLYTIQNALLLQLLYYRLFSVLKDTALKLSNCTLYSWIIYTVLYLALFLFGWVMRFVPAARETGGSMVSASGMLNTLAGFWLAIVFIFKLMRVYKMLDYDSGTVAKESKRTKILAIISKNTVLTLCSMSCIFLTMLMIPLSIRFPSIHVHALMALISTVDVFSNCLCIFLSFNHFASWYRKFCGCCDVCCNACLARCFGAKSATALQPIESKSIVGSSSPGYVATAVGASASHLHYAATASNTASPNLAPTATHLVINTVDTESFDVSVDTLSDPDLSSQAN